jgi:hypothetical protein
MRGQQMSRPGYQSHPQQLMLHRRRYTHQLTRPAFPLQHSMFLRL